MNINPAPNTFTPNHIDTNTGIVEGKILSPNPTESYQLADSFSSFSGNSLNLLPTSIGGSKSKNSLDKTKKTVATIAGTLGAVLGAAAGTAYVCTIVGPLLAGFASNNYCKTDFELVLEQYMSPVTWTVQGARKGYEIGIDAFR